MSGDSSIISIETTLNKAMAILSQKPTESIILAKESYELSKSCSFFTGMIQSNIIISKGHIYSGDMILATQLCEETLELLGNKSGFEHEKNEIHLCLANTYYGYGNFDLALECIQSNTANNNKTIDALLKAKSLTLEGNVYCRLNNYSEAFSSFKRSLDIKQKLNLKGESIAKILMNLATVYIHLDDLNKALKYTNEANKYLDNTNGYSKCIHYLNKGCILGKQGHFKEAIQKFEQALEICNHNKLDRLKASALSNLGEFHYLSGNIDQSLTYAHDGLSLCEKHNFKNNIYIASLLTVFRCYHINDALEAAAYIGKEALVHCKEIGDHHLTIDLLKELITVLEKSGRINEALSVYKELLEMQSEVYKKKRDFDIFQVQSKLEVQMKEQELEMQREAIEQQERHNQELVEVNKELDNFVGVASHDLMEPIRTINSFSKILGKYITEDQKEYEYLHFIQDASDRMDNLVNDLLSYARVGKSIQAPETVKLANSLFIVEQNIKKSINDSNTQVIYNELPTILAHKTSITQLFQNIISNAIKYSKQDVNPIIIVESSISETGKTITFADNGLGINEDQLDSIFEPFTRAYKKQDKAGSGIGLATCKKIVDRYNGKIWATSKLGEGTTIHIFFPDMCQHLSDS